METAVHWVLGCGVLGTAVFEDLVHGETGLSKRINHLLSYLEALGADTRADDCLEIARTGSVTALHLRYHLLAETLNCASPAVVNCSNGAIHRIIEQNRNAIGRPYRYRHARNISDESVHPLQLLASSHRIQNLPNLTPMNLMRLHHIKRKLVIPLSAKRDYTVCYLIFHTTKVIKSRMADFKTSQPFRIKKL